MKNISGRDFEGVWVAELGAASSWREVALRLDPLVAPSPGPQVGTDASSAGRGRSTTGGGSHIAWDSDGGEINPAKTEATHRAAIPTISQLHPSTTLCLFRNSVRNLLSMAWIFQLNRARFAGPYLSIQPIGTWRMREKQEEVPNGDFLHTSPDPTLDPVTPT